MHCFAPALVAVLMVGGAAGAAVSFDAAADFSPTLNPNGPWSYGFSSTAVSPMSLLTQPQNRFVPTQLFGWARDAAPASSSLPAVYHNPGSAPVPVGDYPAPVDPGALVVHPGDLADETYVYVRFTVPVTALYDIAASFEAIDTTAGVQALVITNQSSVLHDQTFSGFGTVDAYTSPLSIALNSGDTIDFIVGNAGAFVNDSVQLNATITQVPAPAAITVLAPLGVVIRRRR